jgi:acetyl esterase
MTVLSTLLRGYVVATRSALRWALRTPGVRRRLLKRRAADVALGLDPDTAVVLALAGLVGQDTAVSGRPSVEREKMRMNIGAADDAPSGAIDVSNESAGGIPARLYVPAGLERSSAGLVFVHGGGWVTGDLDTHDTLCRRIALIAKIRVIAIAPRLAPENPFPATVDDTIAAFRAIAKRAGELGIDPKRLGIGGDSAGGNLSAIVGLETRNDEVKPALTALLYPATDATWSHASVETRGQGYLLTKDSLRWYRDHYIGKDAQLQRDPRVSPLFSSDFTNAPRAIVAVAGFDPLIDEGVAYAKRLEEAGVAVDLFRYDSLIHGFLLMTGVSKAAMSATEEVAKRIGEVLTQSGA